MKLRLTLGHYHTLAVIAAGEDSELARFFQKRIDRAPHGRDEEVLAEDTQVLNLMGAMLRAGRKA